MTKDVINYSQCWEDTDILLAALMIRPSDTVLSITSGGENTLALVAAKPKRVVSIDFNPIQNYVLELKIAALMLLNYKEALEFLGVDKSSTRSHKFKRLQPVLTPWACAWWKEHTDLLDVGVIHAGRFEKFLNLFRSKILPLIHSKKTIHTFVSSNSLVSQRKFYKEQWDSWRWQTLFRLMTSRIMLKRFARQKGMFDHVQMKHTATEYQKRLHQKLHNSLLSQNWYMYYCLMGSYGNSLPNYLQEKNVHMLKKEIYETLSIVTDDMLKYLKNTANNSFTKYNLSDIFEACSAVQYNSIWKEILRTAKPGARIAYWDNLIHREIPKSVQKYVHEENELADDLYAKDKVFFYSAFHVITVIK